jgi:MFS family permease
VIVSRRRLLLLAMIVDTLGGGLLAPFELIYGLRIAHLSLPVAGGILSAAAVAGIVLGPVAGALADRAGPARVAAAANVLGGAGCALLVLAPNAWGYGVGSFCLGGGTRMFWGAFTPLVTAIAEPDQLERWFGRLRGVRNAGFIAGEGLSGLAFLAGQVRGLHLIVLADGLSYLVALALILVAARDMVTEEKPRTGESGGYRSALTDGANIALAALNVLATLLIIAPALALPVFILDGLHLPPWVPGLTAALATGAAAGGLLFGSGLVRGRRRLRNMQIAGGIWMAAFAVLLLARPGTFAYVVLAGAAVLLGLGEVFYAPTADALPAALAPPGLIGRYAAIHQIAWGVSEAAAPLLVAAALSTGNEIVWLVLALLAALSALLYRVLEPVVGSRDGTAGDVPASP